MTGAGRRPSARRGSGAAVLSGPVLGTARGAGAGVAAAGGPILDMVGRAGTGAAVKCLLGVYNSSTSLIKTQRAECELLD
jgi:hypothetical protein